MAPDKPAKTEGDTPAASAQAVVQALDSQLRPWFEATQDPAEAQAKVLSRYLADYVKTSYGSAHEAKSLLHLASELEGTNAAKRGSANPLVAAYRQLFPVMTYPEYKVHINQVLAGDTDVLLHEPPIGWAITRGTTGDEPKFIPITATDMSLRVSAGRAMMAYVAATKRPELFEGVNLNLNFPSVVSKVKVGDKSIEYGYSSGIYAKHVSRSTPIRSVPSQDQIDAIGGDTSQAAWDARFELALQSCRDENVTLVGGVCQTALEFGRYLRKRHGVYPKQLWNTQVMTLGSTPSINTRHAPQLTAMYGPVAIREIYGATEGMFGQQRDERRAWVPNYDLFFFEVLTRSGLKMLYEMQPGETGSLVVSTPVLSRYRIGDIVLALKPPYFRCIGRERWWTRLHYLWNELVTLNLGRL